MEACTRESGDGRSPASWDKRLRGTVCFVTWEELIWDCLSVSSRCPWASSPLTAAWDWNTFTTSTQAEGGRERRSEEKSGHGENLRVCREGLWWTPLCFLTKCKCRSGKDAYANTRSEPELPLRFPWHLLSWVEGTPPELCHLTGPFGTGESTSNMLNRAGCIFVWITQHSPLPQTSARSVKPARPK